MEHLYTFAKGEDVLKYFEKLDGRPTPARADDMNRLIKDLAMLGVNVKGRALQGELK